MASGPIGEPEEPGPVPPVGMPYTVYFPVDGTLHPADLEHAAPLPRIGDTVEYIDESGTCHRYEVAEVIHTLQSSAAHRPHVTARDFAPASFARDEDGGAETPGDGGELRAGLPKVILRHAANREGEPMHAGGFDVRRSNEEEPDG